MTATKNSARPKAPVTGGVLLLAVALTLLFGSQVWGVDHRYDCSSIWSAHPTVWTALNDYETGGGHYMAMGTDVKEADILAEGNYCAVDWETFVTAYPSWSDHAWQYADNIVSSATSNWGGSCPTWILLNEINKDPANGATWTGSSAYRSWVRQVCLRLKDYHGKSICIFSPWQNPSGNSADWQALAGNAYIGDECYLSGQEIAAQSYSASWCQTQYQNSKNSYTALGLAGSKVFLLEHFAHNLSGAGCGRSGLAAVADWILAIQRRSTGSNNVAFNGFVAYGWGINSYGAAEWAMRDSAIAYGACDVH